MDVEYVWFNQASFVQSGVFASDITDHFTVFFILKFGIDRKFSRVVFRDHSDSNLLKLKNYFICFGEYYDQVYIG